MSTDAQRFPLWPWLQAPLAEALVQLKSHATLLHGPDGVGQFEFALALARGWLCESRSVGAEPGPACGRCTSCHLIDAGSHPDLMVVLPEALQLALGWGAAAGEDATGDGEKSGKARKPSQEIKVEAIRQVVQFSQHTASRGRAKVVLVHPAERMNLVAANTLLKTLEEPPGQVRFVLSGAALEQLLPTVRSRCQAWRLPMPVPEVASKWLQATAQGLDEAGAATLLAAAGGQPLTALERHAAGVDARLWAQLPMAIAQGDGGLVSSWPLPLLIETLQKLCHDMCCMLVGSPPRFFPVTSLPAGGDLDRLTSWNRELGKASRHAEHPWNAGLRVESLLIQARAALALRPGASQ